MTRLRLVVALVAVALLAGCASIPLATMWKMRNFGAEELAAIDPDGLRLAARVEPNVRLDPDRSKLTLTLNAEHGPDEVHAFGLRFARIQGGAILPTGQPGWQLFELDEAGRAAVQRLKPRLASVRDHYTGATFSFRMKFAGGMPETVETLRLSVRLQLADDQAPFTLFDRAPIPVENTD